MANFGDFFNKAKASDALNFIKGKAENLQKSAMDLQGKVQEKAKDMLAKKSTKPEGEKSEQEKPQDPNPK